MTGVSALWVCHSLYHMYNTLAQTEVISSSFYPLSLVPVQRQSFRAGLPFSDMHPLPKQSRFREKRKSNCSTI